MTSPPYKITVLISGNGSNLQAIIDAIANQPLSVEITAVISNQKEAYGLTRAKEANIPTYCLHRGDYGSRNEFDEALFDCLKTIEADLIVLAGFMHILNPTFVSHFQGKLINIHPSLLPKYRGLHTYEKVLQSGDHEHGISVHIVTPDLDAGPLIAQVRYPIQPDDTPDSVKSRGQQLEHYLYPYVIQLFAKGELIYRQNTLFLWGKALPSGGLQFQPLDLIKS